MAKQEADGLHARVQMSELHAEVEALRRRVHDADTYQADGSLTASAKALEDVMLAVHNGEMTAVYQLVETYGDCRAREAVKKEGLPS